MMIGDSRIQSESKGTVLFKGGKNGFQVDPGGKKRINDGPGIDQVQGIFRGPEGAQVLTQFIGLVKGPVIHVMHSCGKIPDTLPLYIHRMHSHS